MRRVNVGNKSVGLKKAYAKYKCHLGSGHMITWSWDTYPLGMALGGFTRKATKSLPHWKCTHGHMVLWSCILVRFQWDIPKYDGKVMAKI